MEQEAVRNASADASYQGELLLLLLVLSIINVLACHKKSYFLLVLGAIDQSSSSGKKGE